MVTYLAALMKLCRLLGDVPRQCSARRKRANPRPDNKSNFYRVVLWSNVSASRGNIVACTHKTSHLIYSELYVQPITDIWSIDLPSNVTSAAVQIHV